MTTTCNDIITAIIGTARYILNDDRVWLEEDDGLGAPPNHEIPERGPLQHGDTRVDYRLDPRILQFVFGIEGDSQGQVETQRNRMLSVFRPRDPTVPINLLFEKANGEDRQIDCFYIDSMSFPSKDRKSFYSSVAWSGIYQRFGVTLKAPDPTFYDPVQKTLVFNAGEVVAGMLVPTPVPTRIGGNLINETTTLPYRGTWREYPVVRITGPVQDALIQNTTTGEKLQLKTGTFILPGDYYEIDTRYGYKTVKDSLGNNKIADLTDDSNLATFHLEEYDPGVTTGDNVISVSGTRVSNATAITIYYYERYLGL